MEVLRVLAIRVNHSQNPLACYNFYSPRKISLLVIYKSCLFQCLVITKAQVAIFVEVFVEAFLGLQPDFYWFIT